MNPPLAAAPPPESAMDRPAPALETERSLASDLAQLTKLQLTTLVLVTTLAGYLFANRGPFDPVRLLHTLLGTALVAVCSSILNQAWERDVDARMHRTAQRPLVTRRLPLGASVAAGLALGALGLVELAVFVNELTAFLAALTLAIYILVYTPLKRVTMHNTLIGTIPGALPPLLGATAARGHITVEGWMLFAILALWQLPHFYAIAWLYRDDYRAAGLRMVSVDDVTGRRTAWHALVFAVLLLPVSLLPAWLGAAGVFYAVAAAFLSVAFVMAAIRFVLQTDRPRARTLFLTSITYLPLLLGALALDLPMRALLGR